MAWVDIVGLLALVQLVVFGTMVARARGKYGIAAPATTGHPIFERYYRVQMNTVESLLVFLPALWLAARYWSPVYTAVLGVVYLVGRTIYYFSYISDPSRRSAGYALSMGPAGILLAAALLGALHAALRG